MHDPDKPERRLPERQTPASAPVLPPDEQSGAEAENQLIREEVTRQPPPAPPPLRKDLPPGSE
jgi:hypothetical protein